MVDFEGFLEKIWGVGVCRGGFWEGLKNFVGVLGRFLGGI